MGRRARNKQGDPEAFFGAPKPATLAGKKRKAEDEAGRSATKKQKATAKGKGGAKSSSKGKGKQKAQQRDSDATDEDEDEELLPDADEMWSDELGDE